MKKYLAIALLLAAIAAGVLYIRFLHSPEYALQQTIVDLKADGYSGLRKHLSEDTAEKLDMIAALGENKLFDVIFSALAGSEYMQTIINEARNIEWSVDDILRGKGRATAVVRFSYQDQFSGTIDIEMSSEDGEWKISGIGLPRFE